MCRVALSSGMCYSVVFTSITFHLKCWVELDVGLLTPLPSVCAGGTQVLLAYKFTCELFSCYISNGRIKDVEGNGPCLILKTTPVFSGSAEKNHEKLNRYILFAGDSSPGLTSK
jgi:hypothetical protein